MKKTFFAIIVLCLIVPPFAFAQGEPAAPAASNPLPAALARGILEEEGNLNLRAAIKNYQTVIGQFDEQRRHVATALFRLGECYRKLGQTNEAAAQYQRILREFPDLDSFVTLSQQNLKLLQTASGAPATIEVVGNATLTPDEQDLELRRIESIQRNSPDLINATGKNGETLLQSAAGKGQIAVVRFLLDHGAIVNGLKQPGLTPLHFAAGNGRLAVVDLLLHKGASVDVHTDGGTTPLHLAASKGYIQVTKALLDAGAPVNAAIMINGSSSFDGPDLQYNFTSGATPLTVAVSDGFSEIVELLLGHGADANVRMESGLTSLHLAVQQGRAALVATLVKHGAKVDAADNGGATPLHFAAMKGQVDIMKNLLSAKATVNATNNWGETPLLAAIESRKRSAAEMLLAAGADPNLAAAGAQKAGATPLHFAVAERDATLARVLLEHGANANARGARPSFESQFGGTPLHFDSPGTPLEMACDLGEVEIVKLLLDHQADPDTRRDIENRRPLLAYESVYNNLPILKLFLDHGADPNISDDQGQRPLHFVAERGNTNAVKLLTEHGADVNARTEGTSRTPLHYAVASGRLDLVEALLAEKANPNLADNAGKTPLDYIKSNPTTSAGGFGSPNSRRVRSVPSRPVNFNSFASTAPPSGSSEIADVLRSGGALDEIPRFNRIQVRRPSISYVEDIFVKGTNDWNHFTLLELIANWYRLISTSQEWRTDEQFNLEMYVQKISSPNKRYPDFSHIVLRRPTADGQHWNERQIDFTGVFDSADCAGDIGLEWGDIVEIPEMDHPVNEPWQGLPDRVLDTLKKCLTRKLIVNVKGRSNPLTLSPSIYAIDEGRHRFIGIDVPYMLRPALLRSNLILASSDLTRVKVARADSQTGATREWVFNCAGVQAPPDFWLRDGDQIDLPDK